MTLKELSDKQVRDLAMVHGLEIDGKSVATLRKELRECTSVDPESIEMKPEEEKALVDDPLFDQKLVNSHKFSGRMKRVIFPSMGGVDGGWHIDAALNDFYTTYKRDVPVLVPIEVLAMLDTCIVPRIDVDPATGTETRSTRKRFPYQVLEG